MTFKELLTKYQALILENSRLKDEIVRLNAKLDAVGHQAETDRSVDIASAELFFGRSDEILPTLINNQSDPEKKVKLFMSLFKGRDDVYAKRWENKKKGTTGYSPSCLNEWKSELCRKLTGKCADCPNKAYAVLDERVISDHLRGRNNLVAGIYPLCLDETCYFLAIDFDDEEWQKDIIQLREVCSEFDVSIAIERSRSGNGAHAWIFFEKPLAASLARKLGSVLLTYAMNKRHEITFKSYDRFFPNQDTMPKGGLGNLIALPLQKAARANSNSVFIDEDFEPYQDQWAYLAVVRRLSEDDVNRLIKELCKGDELGLLKIDDQTESEKPWEARRAKLSKDDFPNSLEIVKANMLFIPKVGVSQGGLNHLKRVAAFKNPEFYKAQAMRLSTFDKPRIISCSSETKEYLCLPRGCESDLVALCTGLKIETDFIDKTNHGKSIDVQFKGILRDEQQQAVNLLLKHDLGVLSGTTAFGKTVAAIKIIAERKVNTLILVDKVSLVSQWKKKLKEFLMINEVPSNTAGRNPRGRKKKKDTIGQLGAGKDDLGGIIDIALLQSLNRMGEVKDCVKDYGMNIVDECHHISAFSFEQVLKNSNAKYVYGLTATPIRKDGHQPIIFMQCGPIRYKDDAKKQAAKRPFEHYVIPRFTALRVPLDKMAKDVSIQELYSEIVVNELRNQLIINDIVKSFQNGRNCLVLTERTAHVALLAEKLREKIPEVIAVTGGMRIKETREIMARISEAPADRPLILVATGKYIGEGFDEPRLDTLFLVMPISWKGTLQQYAGRLHRLFENKNEVQIYDYVDIHVRMLEKMYHKRLNGYAAIGYKARCELMVEESINSIFDKDNFFPVYINDIINAAREVLIVSPFITKKRTLQMMQYLRVALENKVRVIVVTRPGEDFKEKDKGRLQETVDLMKSAGISIIFKSQIHQKYAVVDQRLVWYGSINLLSFSNAEESIMRLDSPNIASELIWSIENK